jgi:hypothetical protein
LTGSLEYLLILDRLHRSCSCCRRNGLPVRWAVCIGWLIRRRVRFAIDHTDNLVQRTIGRIQHRGKLLLHHRRSPGLIRFVNSGLNLCIQPFDGTGDLLRVGAFRLCRHHLQLSNPLVGIPDPQHTASGGIGR